MRKLYAFVVGFNAYLFAFGEWLMLAFLGYLTYFKDDYSINDAESIAWYEVTILSLLSGGLSLQVLATIRYWYWDFFYLKEAEKLGIDPQHNGNS